MPKPPNILFILTDNQRADLLGCAGNPIIHTPNMDRLAEGGTRFNNAFCTNALCAPSRATVLTGAFSHINGIRGNSEVSGHIETLDPKVPTFPELLQEAGYQTRLVGSHSRLRRCPETVRGNHGVEEWEANWR